MRHLFLLDNLKSWGSVVMVMSMSKKVYTDNFICLDEEPKAMTFCQAYIAMRERAEREKYNPPVTRWGEEERARAEARLAAMGKSDDPEIEARELAARIRQAETEVRVQDILDRLVNNPPDKAK